MGFCVLYWDLIVMMFVVLNGNVNVFLLIFENFWRFLVGCVIIVLIGNFCVIINYVFKFIFLIVISIVVMIFVCKCLMIQERGLVDDWICILKDFSLDCDFVVENVIG